jgi:hypothetical protein
VPVKYDRELMAKTLRAIKVVSEVRRKCVAAAAS